MEANEQKESEQIQSGINTEQIAQNEDDQPANSMQEVINSQSIAEEN